MSSTVLRPTRGRRNILSLSRPSRYVNVSVEVCDGGWFMVVVIYPDSLQTNSAHKVEYAILLSFIYLQGKSTAANILPEQIDSQSYMWSLGGTTI